MKEGENIEKVNKVKSELDCGFICSRCKQEVCESATYCRKNKFCYLYRRRLSDNEPPFEDSEGNPQKDDCRSLYKSCGTITVKVLP